MNVKPRYVVEVGVKLPRLPTSGLRVRIVDLVHVIKDASHGVKDDGSHVLFSYSLFCTPADERFRMPFGEDVIPTEENITCMACAAYL